MELSTLLIPSFNPRRRIRCCWRKILVNSSSWKRHCCSRSLSKISLSISGVRVLIWSKGIVVTCWFSSPRTIVGNKKSPLKTSETSEDTDSFPSQRNRISFFVPLLLMVRMTMISFAFLEISLSMMMWSPWSGYQRNPVFKNIPAPVKSLFPKHPSFFESNVSEMFRRSNVRTSVPPYVSIGVKPNIMCGFAPALSTRTQKDFLPLLFASIGSLAMATW